MKNPVLLIFVLTFGRSQGQESLCNLPGCRCDTSQDELVDISCDCGQAQEIKLGGLENTHSANFLPKNAKTATFNSCEKVEAYAGVFNNAVNLQNFTIFDTQHVILHQYLFLTLESKNYSKPRSLTNGGLSFQIDNFRLSQIRNLETKRNSFQGFHVDGAFDLNEVKMSRVHSVSFDMDFVNEFTIENSVFERVAMWGFYLKKCNEFNVISNSKFFSLGSQAFRMDCHKFMLAYNVFDSLQHGTFAIKFGFADIQGNVFESLNGRPFLNMEPFPLDEDRQQYQSGFVFRENEFVADPSLPFNALDFTNYDKLKNSENSMVVVESNHFLCDCKKVSWFVAAMTHGFDRDIIEREGSVGFLQDLYDTSDQCLECKIQKCTQTGQKFKDFASKALMTLPNGQLSCSKTGLPLRSQDPRRRSMQTINDLTNIFNKDDEEIDNGQAQKITENGSTLLSYRADLIFFVMSAFFLSNIIGI